MNTVRGDAPDFPAAAKTNGVVHFAEKDYLAHGSNHVNRGRCIVRITPPINPQRTPVPVIE